MSAFIINFPAHRYVRQPAIKPVAKSHNQQCDCENCKEKREILEYLWKLQDEKEGA